MISSQPSLNNEQKTKPGGILPTSSDSRMQEQAKSKFKRGRDEEQITGTCQKYKTVDNVGITSIWTKGNYIDLMDGLLDSD